MTETCTGGQAAAAAAAAPPSTDAAAASQIRAPQQAARQRARLDTVRIENTVLDKVLTWAAFFGCNASIALFIYNWSFIPPGVDTPIHFNFYGEPDNYGGRYFLMMYPFISVLAFLAFNVYGINYPNRIKYPWQVTPRNAAKQYRYVMTYLRVLGFFVCWIMPYIQWQLVEIYKGRATGLHPAAVLIMINGFVLSTIAYFTAAFLAR